MLIKPYANKVYVSHFDVYAEERNKRPLPNKCSLSSKRPPLKNPNDSKLVPGALNSITTQKSVSSG